MLQTSHLRNQLLTRHNRCRRLGQTATASPSRQRWKQIPSCLDIRLSKRKESRRGVNRLRAYNGFLPRRTGPYSDGPFDLAVDGNPGRFSSNLSPRLLLDVLTGTEEPLALPSLGLLEFELSPSGVFNILTDSHVSPSRTLSSQSLSNQQTCPSRHKLRYHVKT